jgi:hypothetical protein
MTVNQTSQIKPKRKRRTRDESAALLDTAYDILAEGNPMTVRQVYYQLVARQLIPNNRSQYQAVSNLLVEARKTERVPWEWIEDRNRKARDVAMWDDLDDFILTVRGAYRRDVWQDQAHQVEAWLEKDALSGIFSDALQPYGVTLNVGRGYDGWSSIRNAAERIGDGDDTTILYFGDFDPSGEDMFRSLVERLGFFGCKPEIIKCALTLEDIRRYNLPSDLAKTTDSRHAGHVAKWGDVSVELDALPPAVLRQRLIDEVRSRLDLSALEETRQQERIERNRLSTLLDKSE